MNPHLRMFVCRGRRYLYERGMASGGGLGQAIQFPTQKPPHHLSLHVFYIHQIHVQIKCLITDLNKRALSILVLAFFAAELKRAFSRSFFCAYAVWNDVRCAPSNGRVSSFTADPSTQTHAEHVFDPKYVSDFS